MMSQQVLEEQLKKINFHYAGWGKSEVMELPHILMEDEEIEECVNGYYEAGFALLVGTKDRVLLVDKKPLGYLTVEDLRFDMINELDLHHRLFGAQIRISAGNKTLHFTSLNQARLRRLLNYIQSRMTQIKKKQDSHQYEQKQHLEEMNEQLRLYLMAAHKQQYVDQAQSIQFGMPSIAKPAPYQEMQQQNNPYQALPEPDQPVAAPYQMQAEQPQPGVPNPSLQPMTPFEQVASAAFDSTTMQQGYAQPQPQPPQTVAASSPVQNNPQPQPVATAIASPLPVQHRGAHKPTEPSMMTPQQIGLAAARRVVPIISAYTRLPLISQRRRPGVEKVSSTPASQQPQVSY